jgi:hypothetical protein
MDTPKLTRLMKAPSKKEMKPYKISSKNYTRDKVSRRENRSASTSFLFPYACRNERPDDLNGKVGGVCLHSLGTQQTSYLDPLPAFFVLFRGSASILIPQVLSIPRI